MAFLPSCLKRFILNLGVMDQNEYSPDAFGYDLCYILGPEKKYEEFRFSLRSAEKNISFRSLFVVGSKPDWLTNVNYTENHPEGCKASRIMQNIKLICENPDVSEKFIFMNDDYFLLRPFDFKYWHKGTLRDRMEVLKTGDYYRHLLATEMALKKRGFSTLQFDLHYPIIYEKKKLLEVIEMYDWNIPDGYTMKSLYCNTLGIDGEYKEDCKAYKNENWSLWTSGKEMFSTSDTNFNKECKNFLLNLYPEPSKFEK